MNSRFSDTTRIARIALCSAIVGAVFPPASAIAQNRAADTAAVTEWNVPWADTRPRDPSLDAQGRVWFVGQEGSYVARLDPTSGAITRYPMPDPDAKDPHTIAFDKQGNLWFTLQNSNMVGHLVKKTGKVTIMKMSTP